MVCGLMAVGGIREALAVTTVEDVELVTNESGNREALNELVTTQADTEKANELDVEFFFITLSKSWS